MVNSLIENAVLDEFSVTLSVKRFYVCHYDFTTTKSNSLLINTDNNNFEKDSLSKANYKGIFA